MKTSNLNHQRQSDQRADHPRDGFTLIEMIVSVALVLLMMLMFTQIFQILSAAMTTQRGISENDQRERLLTTVLQADLDNRSFQYLLPYSDNTSFPVKPDDPRSPLFHKEDRQGYFYISENDPNDDTDDFIQFTVSRFASPKQGDTEDFYYGRATDLSGLPTTGGSRLVDHPNQPEADDGRIMPDGTSQSSAAEVCYFLRGSNLYRRVMLIREPLSLSSTQNSQPISADNNSSPFFQRTGSPPLPLYGEHRSAEHNFWGHFDYSAFIDTSGNVYARFHDLDDLDNSDATGSSILFPLGMPQYRFGFNHATGLSREFVPSSAGGNPQIFTGRFTHEETSHPHFNYPHDPMDNSIGGGGNPMDPAGPNLLVNPNDRVIDLLRNGTRRSEDLVLSNVRSFDIKVFDDVRLQFVDIGGASAGRFAAGARQNNDHGNSNTIYNNNVFDTWHVRAVTNGTDGDPPYPMLSDKSIPEYQPQSPVYDIANETPFPRAAPLTAIRILIRYEDPSSGQVRQMTLIHPLRNRGEG
tara:strand:- start:48952 stop:50523 length:1572 start_codon:yes stop_codon:yes gene_type:complete